MALTQDQAIVIPEVVEAIRRGIIQIDGSRVTYHLGRRRSYCWTDPEEWVRAKTIAWLVTARGYPANRLVTEVLVPRRTPSDYAYIVVYEEDQRRNPYLVVENKSDTQSAPNRRQAIEQLFGNVNSLRAPFGLYDEYGTSILFDIANHPPTERRNNRLGTRNSLPSQYGTTPKFIYIAGGDTDIRELDTRTLESRSRYPRASPWHLKNQNSNFV